MPIIRERDPDLVYSRADRDNGWAGVLLVVMLLAVLAFFAFQLLASENDRNRLMDQLNILRLEQSQTPPVTQPVPFPVPQPIAVPQPVTVPQPVPVPVPTPVQTPGNSNENSGTNSSGSSSSTPSESIDPSGPPGLGGGSAGDSTTPQ